MMLAPQECPHQNTLGWNSFFIVAYERKREYKRQGLTSGRWRQKHRDLQESLTNFSSSDKAITL